MADENLGTPTGQIPTELFIRAPRDGFLRKVYLTVKQAFKNDSYWGATPIYRYVLDPDWKREDHDSTN